MSGVYVEFCGERTPLVPGQQFVVGREGALRIDDNPYLHRRFLILVHEMGFWWLVNEGARLSATVSTGTDGLQAWLPPGARLPLVFSATTVVFTAGPVTYEFGVHIAAPTFQGIAGVGRPALSDPSDVGSIAQETTIGDLPLTPSQKALIVALAEPMLARDGTGTSAIPSSGEAAQRLAWSMSKFNRKLDNVCDKFARIGIAGLRGDDSKAAMGRRARLVEYALAARVVTRADLSLLDEQKD